LGAIAGIASAAAGFDPGRWAAFMMHIRACCFPDGLTVKNGDPAGFRPLFPGQGAA